MPHRVGRWATATANSLREAPVFSTPFSSPRQRGVQPAAGGCFPPAACKITRADRRLTLRTARSRGLHLCLKKLQRSFHAAARTSTEHSPTLATARSHTCKHRGRHEHAGRRPNMHKCRGSTHGRLQGGQTGSAMPDAQPLQELSRLQVHCGTVKHSLLTPLGSERGCLLIPPAPSPTCPHSNLPQTPFPRCILLGRHRPGLLLAPVLDPPSLNPQTQSSFRQDRAPAQQLGS